jgi:hypothetical protein
MYRAARGAPEPVGDGAGLRPPTLGSVPASLALAMLRCASAMVSSVGVAHGWMQDVKALPGGAATDC